MGRALAGLAAQLIMALLVFAVNLCFALSASLIRSLPWLLPLLWRFGCRALFLTCRLYEFILTPLTPVIRRRLHIDLFHPFWRRFAALALSLATGVLLLLLLQSPFHLWALLYQIPLAVWVIALCVGHGLLVNRFWEASRDTGGLRMGDRL